MIRANGESCSDLEWCLPCIDHLSPSSAQSDRFALHWWLCLSAALPKRKLQTPSTLVPKPWKRSSKRQTPIIPQSRQPRRNKGQLKETLQSQRLLTSPEPI